MKIAVLIPTLNEGESIKRVIESIPDIENADARVYVIDGCSTDGTQENAVTAGATLIEEPRKGYGRAYRTGLERIKADIYVTLDGDNSYPAEEIPRLVKKLIEGGYDFISGFRRPLKGSMSLSHRLGNSGLSFLTNLLFGFRIKDSQSGMWIFTKELLRKMELHGDGMFFSIEIKLEACKNGKFKEIRIPLKPRVGIAKIKIIDGFKIAKLLLKRRIRILFA